MGRLGNNSGSSGGPGNNRPIGTGGRNDIGLRLAQLLPQAIPRGDKMQRVIRRTLEITLSSVQKGHSEFALATETQKNNVETAKIPKTKPHQTDTIFRVVA